MHNKALKQGRYQSPMLPLVVALGRRLKVTTYGKALKIQHCPQLRLVGTLFW
jgi:hypothetical protein